MPAHPVLLAECELPLNREALTSPRIISALHDGLRERHVTELAVLPQPRWWHAFLVVAGEPGVDVRGSLLHRHALNVLALRHAATKGTLRAYLRLPARWAMHDLFASDASIPSGQVRIQVFVVGSLSDAVPAFEPAAAMRLAA